MSKSDELSLFWPEWHKYTHCPKTKQKIHGDRILIRTNHNPDKEKFIQWSDNLLLLGRSPDSKLIIGPFDFENIDKFNRERRVTLITLIIIPTIF